MNPAVTSAELVALADAIRSAPVRENARGVLCNMIPTNEAAVIRRLLELFADAAREREDEQLGFGQDGVGTSSEKHCAPPLSCPMPTPMGRTHSRRLMPQRERGAAGNTALPSGPSGTAETPGGDGAATTSPPAAPDADADHDDCARCGHCLCEHTEVNGMCLWSWITEGEQDWCSCEAFVAEETP